MHDLFYQLHNLRLAATKTRYRPATPNGPGQGSLVSDWHVLLLFLEYILRAVEKVLRDGNRKYTPICGLFAVFDAEFAAVLEATASLLCDFMYD